MEWVIKRVEWVKLEKSELLLEILKDVNCTLKALQQGVKDFSLLTAPLCPGISLRKEKGKLL